MIIIIAGGFVITDNRGHLVKVSQHPWAETFYTFSRAGVIRGMHWQEGADKLVHCVSGMILDITLRLDTKEVTKMVMVDGDSLFVPSAMPHGFLALTDCIVLYQMSEKYEPTKEGGFRWDSFGMLWPVSDPILSERDRNLPYFKKSNEL